MKLVEQFVYSRHLRDTIFQCLVIGRFFASFLAKEASLMAEASNITATEIINQFRDKTLSLYLWRQPEALSLIIASSIASRLSIYFYKNHDTKVMKYG